MIPVNTPKIGERELAYVTQCVESGWISSQGTYISRFEGDWAEYCGRRHGVAVSNGTTALQLAVASLGLEPGSEIIMPTFTIISCALAAVYNDCVPVLVDSEPDTWCMNVDDIASRITPRTAAIMVVHIYGHPVDMGPVLDLASEHSLAVIEDAAEAHGAAYCRPGGLSDWQRCGSFGTVSTFSFYANKIITTGEGGMLLTDDDNLADRARLLRNLAFQPGRRFWHEQLGFNFRMTNVQAALGVAQTERIEEIVSRKRDMALRYSTGLSDIGGLQLPLERPWARSVYWMYGVVIGEETGMDGGQLTKHLHRRGIETRPFFLGMHEQPALHERGLFKDDSHPVAERLARRGVYLPSGLGLADDSIDMTVDAVREVMPG